MTGELSVDDNDWMAGTVTAPQVIALGRINASAVLWRHRGKLHVTVIGKATFALVEDGAMTPVAPEPVLAAEVHHGNLPNRSIRYAADTAPRLDRVDVLLTGHAYAVEGRTTEMQVRLAVHDGDRALLDKRLLAVDPAGFTKMPLVYERALGGIGQPDNPLGREVPTLVDPASPAVPAGLGPIARGWQARRKLLGNTARKAVDAEIADLPDDFDFTYFQAAPADQRIPALSGHEQILLEGVHPLRKVLRSRLPDVSGKARIEGLKDAGIAEGTTLPLRILALHIDADEQWCAVVLRGSFEVPDEAAARAARIVVGIAPASGEEQARASASLARAAGAKAGGAKGTAVMVPEGTIELSEADIESTDTSFELSDEDDTLVKSERRAKGAAGKAQDQTIAVDAGRGADSPTLPFQRSLLSAMRSAPPAKEAAVAPSPAAQPPAPSTAGPEGVLAVASAPSSPLSPEVTIIEEETLGADDADTPAPETLPFLPDAEPQLPEPEGVPAPRAPTDTLYLAPEEQASAAGRELLPFITTGSAEARGEEVPRGPSEAPFVPPRASDAIPVVTRAPFVAWTMPWQVARGRDVRTVIVKCTCDLAPSGAVTVRAEPEAPSGDVAEGHEALRALRYPSDFVVFKPRADVTLTGHACALGSATAAEVGLSFGHEKNRFERRIAVIGDRFWQGHTASAPKVLERIPLSWERAYGGADFEKNPLGRGRAAGPDGRTALPNLESRDELIGAPSHSPEPVCFAPVPADFHARASKLGSYGPAWVKERWPYFPDDIDWACFQHAPLGQRLGFLQGDEPFLMWGVRADAPRISGALPGLVPRVLAQRTTAAGGLLFEVALRLDTVAIDADAMTITLVWRGLFDVADKEATDIAELYLFEQRTKEAPIDLAAARARYEAERGPWALVAEEPGARAANVGQSGRGDSRFDPAALVASKLRAAGVATAGAAASRGAVASAASEPPEAPVRSAEEDAALRAEVSRRLSDGGTLEGLDLSGADLSGLDFRRKGLAFVVLKGAKLAGCRFDGADLSGAVLAGADLSSAVLERATLTGADFTSADLTRANLDEAEVSAADLSFVVASEVSLRRARGAGCRMTGALLAKARFDGAELRGLDLTRAALDGAVLDDVVAPEVRLYDAGGTGASFERADLAGARADGASLTRCSFAGVKAAGSVWDKAMLDGSVFRGADLVGAGMTQASCCGAAFSGARLIEARLDRAALVGAMLAGADLMRASLEGADLTGADLRGANLYAAETWQAKLAGAKLERAITAGTKLPKEKR